MAKLIKNKALVDDPWHWVKESSDFESFATQTTSPLLVPLPLWLEHKPLLKRRNGQCGVWLDSHELPSELGEDLHSLGLIALHFPVFSDGRPYSSARELRSNYAYKGELRAIGDVLRDQLFYMARCGFDAFALRDDQDVETALSAFADFRDAYQSSCAQPTPLFRRRG